MGSVEDCPCCLCVPQAKGQPCSLDAPRGLWGKCLGWSLLRQSCHHSGNPHGSRPGAKIQTQRKVPPRFKTEAEAGAAPRGLSPESQLLADQSSLKEGEERGGQGWSWQEPRGGRKQETIKEKSNPGLGLAEAMGPCRLSSGWHGGGFLGADGAPDQLPGALWPWAVGVLKPLPDTLSLLTGLLDPPKIITTLPL